MRNVPPVNTMAIALGLHARVGTEDTLVGPQGRAPNLRRTGPAARPPGRRARPRDRHRQGTREIYNLDEHYTDTDDTFAKIGYAPNRRPGQRGFTDHA